MKRTWQVAPGEVLHTERPALGVAPPPSDSSFVFRKSPVGSIGGAPGAVPGAVDGDLPPSGATEVVDAGGSMVASCDTNSVDVVDPAVSPVEVEVVVDLVPLVVGVAEGSLPELQAVAPMDATRSTQTPTNPTRTRRAARNDIAVIPAHRPGEHKHIVSAQLRSVPTVDAAPISVAFDATACLGHTTGVGTFVGEALTGLAARDDVEVTAYALSWRGRGRLVTVVPPGVRVATRPAAARPLRRLWLRSDFPPAEWLTGRVGIVHGPNYVVPPTRHAAAVVSVFDLTPLRYPELSNADTLDYPRLIERAIGRGAWIHTCSEFIATEIREHFDVDDNRVVVVPAGVRPAGLPRSRDPVGDIVGRLSHAGDPFLLALGTVEPRKDLPALVAAFDRLAEERPSLRLVIAGPDGWGTDELREAIAGVATRDRIDRVGWVGEAERAALLANASVLVYPSRYEGFGLPPLEAMAASTPVVTTDAGALPEVVGEVTHMVSAQLLAEDRDAGIRALGDAIAEVLDEDDEAHRRRIARGHERIAELSWERTVDGLVELYRRVARHNGA